LYKFNQLYTCSLLIIMLVWIIHHKNKKKKLYHIEQPWPRTRMLSSVDIDLRNVHIKVNAVCRWWRQEAWIIDQGYQTIAYAVGYRNNQTFCLRNQIKEQLLSPELLWNIFFLIFKISTLKLYKKKKTNSYKVLKFLSKFQ
jgi:hypothetical protein